jgi:DNA transformation protein
MAISAGFRDFVLDQLAGVPGVRARRMFGGMGLYAGDVFFAILSHDELYFKTDDRTKERYEAAGSKPFKPYADRPMTMAYWTVPPELLDDPTELVVWAREAIGVATAAPKAKRPSRTAGSKAKRPRATSTGPRSKGR